MLCSSKDPPGYLACLIFNYISITNNFLVIGLYIGCLWVCISPVMMK
jgi:hypothetical protein